MAHAPLEGLLVVSVEQAVAAPFCTARLADAGARVIKVERPEGDFARGYDTAAGGLSSYFVWLNRGKQSLALDLKAPADRALFERIVARADVLVQNLKPGALDRLGVGPGDLRARHPRLITCSISGYGETGPYAGRKAYDLLIQADSGLCSITGGPDEPARVGISIVDIATGATAHAAILEALIGRGIHGRGADIRISMFDVIADWLAVPYLHAKAGKPPKRIGLAHPSICPYGVFTTLDGAHLLIAIQNEREFASFASRVLGDPDLPCDPVFASNNARVAHRVKVDATVAARLGERTRADVVQALLEADIAFADVNDLSGLIDHPHLTRATVETATGPQDLPAPAAAVDGTRRIGSRVPGLGADTSTIRAEFAGAKVDEASVDGT
ncbi:carnitine dehydratase [Defluviimonas sp. 20V17]|uniref:CoA transferase n=1 Tax=Allgaiera indica TaxID=765699 RepID=A0AAN5A1A6_9RHOB|nr:CaiB/BaiF CoA-transferase family protein [Allgaiera indica]KDB01687.1 carnitine dehydratase [Defluviimonas sp. 20V17]GHE04021.1 CoA transferase [Allgaiera indica]SDX34069.1 Crotonobetainyl-CoA:carnitine CoA-transferase CaiB [Allgaiera indica]